MECFKGCYLLNDSLLLSIEATKLSATVQADSQTRYNMLATPSLDLALIDTTYLVFVSYFVYYFHINMYTVVFISEYAQYSTWLAVLHKYSLL